uniref:WGS project CBMG000000000 data, contig CS5907-c002495 n=1 Tax=Fusarium acuminatum CS5907 TaxID=1318461 RepID=A0A090MFY9_9HYPO|nr:unnamed protein product [Fusarium acuminatum CS5907]
MARGEAQKTKVFYKTKNDGFIVYVDDDEAYKKWRNDKSIPLVHFVSAFKIFVTHKQGTQGALDTASNAELDNEFGTHNVDEAISTILEKGSSADVTMWDRQGFRNDSCGQLLYFPS